VSPFETIDTFNKLAVHVIKQTLLLASRCTQTSPDTFAHVTKPRSVALFRVSSHNSKPTASVFVRIPNTVASNHAGLSLAMFRHFRQFETNPLTPNDTYSGRTAPLTSKRFILYIYSINTGAEYFKHGIYYTFFFSLQNAVCFIILT